MGHNPLKNNDGFLVENASILLEMKEQGDTKLQKLIEDFNVISRKLEDEMIIDEFKLKKMKTLKCSIKTKIQSKITTFKKAVA